jgi:hypothetical protein
MIQLNPVLTSQNGKLLVGDTNSTGKFTNLSYSESGSNSNLISSGTFLLGTTGSNEFRIQTNGSLKWSVGSNGALSAAVAANITTGGSVQSPTLENIGFTDLNLNSNNAGIKFYTSNTSRWEMSSAGNLLPATSGTLNIGSSSNPIQVITGNNLSSSPAQQLNLQIGGSTRWIVEPNSGNLQPNGANTYGIGGGSRPCNQVWTRVLTSDAGQNLVLAENGAARWTLEAGGNNLTAVGGAVIKSSNSNLSLQGNYSFGSTGAAIELLNNGPLNLVAQDVISIYNAGGLRWTFNTSGDIVPASGSQSIGTNSSAILSTYTRNVSSDGTNNLNLQVGGSTKVYITNAGDLIAGGISTTYLNIDNTLTLNDNNLTSTGDLIFNNGQWLRLYASGTERWRMFGNGELLAVQESVNHFFGTFSNTSLFFRTNNQNRLYLEANASNLVGVGSVGLASNGGVVTLGSTNDGNQDPNSATIIITGFGGPSPKTLARFTKNSINLQCPDRAGFSGDRFWLKIYHGAQEMWAFYNAIDDSLADGMFAPPVTNAFNIGHPSHRVRDIHTQAITIYSDERGKNTIQPSTLGLDFINSLNPVSYKMNVGRNQTLEEEDGTPIIVPISGVRTHWGLLAQEVKAVIPSGVDFAGWVLADLEDPDSQQSLRYYQFICPLIKAIQELTARVESLENP